ncbi:hypothetical protein KAU11_03610, partial [Candidatus Babeliales bacterium]|nr:hypothetical protein [Candidatus Babeliales bacterium]
TWDYNSPYEYMITGRAQYSIKELEKLVQEINKKQCEFWMFVLAVSVAVFLIVGFVYLIF